MRTLIKPGSAGLLLSAVLLAGVAAPGGPACAQAIVDEVVVVGRLGPDGQVRSLSQPVSFSDLDLRYSDGRAELSRRITDTARSLCDQLGESATASGPAPSCRQAAVKDAMSQARRAYAAAEAGAYDTALAAADAAAPASDTVAEAPLAPTAEAAPDAASYAAEASYTTRTVTNGPVADTPENRGRYGAPMSNAGRRTTPAGN